MSKQQEAKVHTPTIAAEMKELIESGRFKTNVFDLTDGLYTAEFAQKVATLPILEIGHQPIEVPSSLAQMAEIEEVILRERYGDKVISAGLLRSLMEKKIELQRQGFYDLWDVASILVQQTDEPVERCYRRLVQGVRNGRLKSFDEYKRPIEIKSFVKEFGHDALDRLGCYGETTKRKYINAWLKETGDTTRFPKGFVCKTPEPDAKSQVQDSPCWEQQAQDRARKIIKEQKAQDLYPSQMAIADKIAKEFRANNIHGTSGKPLTGSYIKRHALKGISSAIDKQQSTETGRGK